MAENEAGGKPDRARAGLASRRRADAATTAIVAIVSLAAMVLLAGIAREWLVVVRGEESGLPKLGRFALDGEGGVPAWFSSSLMLAIAGLSSVLASVERQASRRCAWAWGGLAVVFVALSLDEIASFHEAAIVPIRERLGVSGILHFAWIVPAIPMVGLFALAYARFLLSLPRSTSLAFVLAGALFVGGAIGMEMVSGYLVTTHQGALRYAVAMILEETLEITGLCLFLAALIRYAAARGLRITTHSPKE